MKNIKYILIITTLILSSCKNRQEKVEENQVHSENEQANNNEIKITEVQFISSKMQLGSLIENDFPEVVKTTGMIDVPPQSVEIISSFYGGYIKKSNLLIGDKVRKGQAVVTLENPDFVDMQQNYLEIKAQLNYLKSEFERQKILFDEKIISQKSYLKAESDYNLKKATLSGLAKKLKMLNISPLQVSQTNMTSVITLYATINGSISKINVSKGTHISPADEIMEIVNIDHIHIELKVFEKDAMKIKKDQKIRFRIPEASSEYFDAEVHLVGKTIDENLRTIKVHGHLHEETKNIFDIGMFVDAEIITTSKQALSLPKDAVVESGDHLVVLKLKNQENKNYYFEAIEVEVGKKHDNYIKIISDKIHTSDKILIKGAYFLVGADGGGHSH